MQIRQLVTVLGLCLSQARAMVVAPANDDAIKSFVLLVTQPDAAIDKSPLLSTVAETLHQKAHTMNHNQFHLEVAKTAAPLLEGNEDNAKYIADGVLGYREAFASEELKAHPVLRAKRLQAYRNLIYSQFKEVAEKTSTKFNSQSLEELRAHLLKFLGSNGDAQTAHKPEEFLAKFEDELHSFTPNGALKFQHLSPEQINQQLLKTNVPGVPEASLIDGQSFHKLMAAHAQHHHSADPVVPHGPVVFPHPILAN